MSAKSSARLRSALVFLLKVSVVAILLAWMLHSEKLDLKTTSLLLRDRAIFWANLGVWAVGAIFMSSLRLQLLLRGLHITVGLFRAASLNLMGFFFSTVMPGAVGGDLIKALYIYRSHSGGRKTPTLLAIFLDRLIGLYALFAVAVLALITQGPVLWDRPGLAPLLTFSVLAFACMTGAFVVILWPSQRWQNFLEHLIGRLRIPPIVRIYQALRLYSNRPQYLLLPCLISVMFQSFYLAFYWLVATRIVPQPVHMGLFAAILPIGQIAVALPIAPGGLGVGHAAFDQLFRMIGLSGGANVFNIVFFGQMILNLTGVVPYLFLKAKVQGEVREGLERGEGKC